MGSAAPADAEKSSQSQPKSFKAGQIIDGKWRIRALLGKGACGVVYKVEDKKKKGWMAAMKIEYISPDYDQTLRLEIGVLNKLKKKKDMLKLLDYGGRRSFTYMVTSLCGKDLMALRCKIKRGFNDSTALRIAVFTLYGLKQTHEAGYVHRDVKPGNIITASKDGRDSRCMLLIDFGMARSFITTDKEGKKQMRLMRRRIPLRGTVRYCSLNVHDRCEQGRCDDLISMMYMLVEVTLGVPWHNLKDEKEVMAMKKATKDTELFEELPEEFRLVFEYLKPLCYHDRPCYLKIYNLLFAAIKRLKINFLDPYEWEDEEIEKDAKLEKAAKEEQAKKAKDVQVGGEAEKSIKAEATQVATDDKTSKEAMHPSREFAKSEYDTKTLPPDVKPDTNNNNNNSVIAKSVSELVQPPREPNLDTAIDYDPSENTTKKALNRDELQFVVFPSVAISNFKEHALSF